MVAWRSVKDVLKELLVGAVEELYGNHGELVHITSSTNANYGDFQSNIGFLIAKSEDLNPMDVTSALSAYLNDQQDPLIESYSASHPGFLNIQLSDHGYYFWADMLYKCLQKSHAPDYLFPIVSHHKKHVCVDFSSPNMSKVMHVGHLRSTILGDTLARLNSYMGNTVKRISHVGDWGKQMAMVISYVKINNIDLNKESSESLLEIYKAAHQQEKLSTEFSRQTKQSLKSLQEEEPESFQIWQKICEISRLGFEQIYDQLNIDIEEKGESAYRNDLGRMVAYLEHKGLVTISDKAKCIYVPSVHGGANKKLLPMIIEKSDGTYNYSTTDLAALQSRIKEKFDVILYVVDSGQKKHFELLFKVAEMADLYDPHEVCLEHIDFGVITGANHKKIKTREGETIQLKGLLEEAITRAKEMLLGTQKNYSVEAIDRKSKIIAINSIKFTDLYNNRVKTYQFDFDHMLRIEGGNALYIMYTYARLLSILRKSEKESFLHSGYSFYDISPEMLSKSDASVLQKMTLYPEAIIDTYKSNFPHILAHYIDKLCMDVNIFLEQSRVIGSGDVELFRLMLCDCAKEVIVHASHILGMVLLEEI